MIITILNINLVN